VTPPLAHRGRDGSIQFYEVAAASHSTMQQSDREGLKDRIRAKHRS
jgi:hypothetical protein